MGQPASQFSHADDSYEMRRYVRGQVASLGQDLQLLAHELTDSQSATARKLAGAVSVLQQLGEQDNSHDIVTDLEVRAVLLVRLLRRNVHTLYGPRRQRLVVLFVRLLGLVAIAEGSGSPRATTSLH